ncbi:7643_t:CDS:2 [Cetraspora pellucida]|uniref:7643_t:CDS:1 n=1 Tax=Cetraspora pellucida TaxID=1433469 RepID=A0A9N9GT38_9GLOM|nr:7643_t:CDS:2 [Cetraspora pellucida]
MTRRMQLNDKGWVVRLFAGFVFSKSFLNFELKNYDYINNTFLITKYTNEDEIKYVNIFVENIKDSSLENIHKEYKNGLEDKLEDSSLKKISMKQIIISFKMLEQYLKYYSTKIALKQR